MAVDGSAGSGEVTSASFALQPTSPVSLGFCALEFAAATLASCHAAEHDGWLALAVALDVAAM